MKVARILITGSRTLSGYRQVFDELSWAALVAQRHTYDRLVIVHGGARGADSIAQEWVAQSEGVSRYVHYERIRESTSLFVGREDVVRSERQLLIESEVHPADWDTHGKAAGPIRNQEMVKLGALVCLAFPLGEARGTRDCMARALSADIPLRVWGKYVTSV